MCNLYSLTKGQAAIRDWFRARHDRTGQPAALSRYLFRRSCAAGATSAPSVCWKGRAPDLGCHEGGPAL